MLSKRLKAVANLLSPCEKVADVGTDHGYVPIYLVKENICQFAYAMDVNEGPLNIAKSNIAQEGLEKNIETILSDGFDNFGDRDVDSVIIAGMGGDLIVDILSRARVYDFDELVLSPHKRPDLVRKFLSENGYKISDEKMVKDAGKYYPAIKAKKGESEYDEVQLEFGPILLNEKDETLKEYLDIQLNKFGRIISSLEREDKEAEHKYKLIKKGLEYYV